MIILKKLINFKLCSHYLLLLFILQISSCASLTYKVPKDYVPDEKVVYLKQRVDLQPIKHTPKETNPYLFIPSFSVNKINPEFIKITNFQHYLKPDFNNDAKVFNEMKEHFKYIKTDKNFLELKNMLNSFKFNPPAKMKLAKGKLVKKYNNANEYNYPLDNGATIVIFQNGEFQIKRKNGNIYSQKRNGNYFEKDRSGKTLYAYFPEYNEISITKNNAKYIKLADKELRVETPKGIVSKFSHPIPQYKYIPSRKNYEYTLFYDENENYFSIALIHKNNLRYDFLYNTNQALIIKDNDGIGINENYSKSHHYFNPQTNKNEDFYSLFLKEGLRIVDINKSLTYSELKPNWPERYLVKKVGPFKFYYVKKDEKLIQKIDQAKLEMINNFVYEKTNINYAPERHIIIPPNLESYRKLHAGDQVETLEWYPTGFAGKDLVIMWPFSVKRYKHPLGQAYFYEQEFYDILLHEMIHIAVGQITGVFSPVPTWLNEGLAVYVESEWSKPVKKYWETTFTVSYNQKRLLDWNQVTSGSTANYPISSARVFYAQSYKMVSFLIRKYGIKNVVRYIRSFKLNFNNQIKVDLNKSFKINFENVFGVSWENNLNDFDQSLKITK